MLSGLPEITAHLTAGELRGLLDPTAYLGAAPALTTRALTAPTRALTTPPPAVPAPAAPHTTSCTV